MKKNAYKIVLFGIVLGITHSAYSGNGEPKNNLIKPQESFRLQTGVTANDYEANTIILKLKPAYRDQARTNAINDKRLVNVFAELGTQNLTKLFPTHTALARSTDEAGNQLADLSLIYKFNFTSNTSIVKAINKIIATGMVEYAEPNYIYNVLSVTNPIEDTKKVLAAFNPNDPSINQQYFIGKIKCPEAWGINTTTARGDTNVVIGIVDTGSDLDHPDLKSKIKYNYSDPINGKDDDNDGFIDNFRGWDIADKDNDATVDNVANNHGSHVSGCAAAATNNGVGVASPGFNCKFLPVKATKTGSKYIDNGYEGIAYAADHGCSIINNSWGGVGGGQFGQDVITYASINKKALVIASAGNDGKEVTNYPASYNYVLSIGATTSTDAKSSFSTYAYSVDVCAPGSGIYSTIYNDSYESLDGTSMAGPICAGAAAIVKSFYPSYTGLQVGEQLRVTADNIYGVGSNNTYKDKIGTGRINLYRALTESSPSLRMMPITPIDGNDETFIVGDTIKITGKMINYLAPATNMVATLSSTNTNINILNPTINIGTIGTLAELDVTALNAYRVVIKPSATTNEKVLFKLSFSDGSYSANQYFSITVNVDYVNININAVASTNTSRGRIGYNESDVTAGGLGFTYNDTASLTYEMGLMIGVSSSKVCDNIRGSNAANDADFVSVQVVKQRIPAVQSEFDTYGVFNDNGAASSKIGVEVKHNSYAWNTPGDKKYIIFEYIIKNTSGSTLSNLYAGVLSDWDITEQTSGSNKVATDNANKLGYAYSTVDPKFYAGIRVVSKTPFLHYAIDNIAGGGGGIDPIDKTDKFSTADKYITLSTNRPTAGNGASSGGDIMSVVSTGPFTINNKDSVKVAFAVLAGDDLNDLKNSSINAQVKYDNMVTAIPTITGADGFSLKQNYPNPVNTSKTIIEFNLPTKSQAEVTIYNSLGQKVMNVLNTTQLEAGPHQLNVDLSDFSNGLYFYELKAGNNAAMMKMIVQH